MRQSNLCLEIALPTKPLNDVNDENGEIALCTLSAFNLGAINSLDELEELAILAVRALDALLDYQDYPIPRQTWSDGSSYAGYWCDQLRLLPGEARCALLRRQRQQPDA